MDNFPDNMTQNSIDTINNIDNNFNRFKQHHTPATLLGDDFESRVFAKIKKKKTRRKVAASTAMAMTVFAVVFVAAPLFFKGPADIQPGFNLANHDLRMSSPGQHLPEDWLKNRQEVPALEEVIYASSDSNTNYAIETVANFEDDNTL